MGMGFNYESAPWLALNDVWTQTVERRTGTDVGKGSDFVGFITKMLFWPTLDFLFFYSLGSITVEKLQSFYEILLPLFLLCFLLFSKFLQQCCGTRWIHKKFGWFLLCLFHRTSPIMFVIVSSNQRLA